MTRRDPLASVGAATRTPQMQPMPGVANQVRNDAGGYVFGKDMWQKVEDFLILGTAGGTYYISEDKLTERNTKVIFDAVQADGARVVNMVTEIATSRPPRAPKPRPYIFALAAAAAMGDAATKQAVKAVFPEVVRTTDHLAMFFGYWKNLSGKPTARGTAPVIGRAMRTTLGSWFTAGDAHGVAFKSLKARQRATPQGEAMALADVLRIAHPKAGLERKALLGWLAGKVEDDMARREVADIDNFLVAQSVTSPAAAIRVVKERNVPWEFLPSDVLKDKGVWEALIDTIGMTALLRNLARMTRIGTLAPFAIANQAVVARLTNADAIIKARIHPMDAYLALKVYGSGLAERPRGDAERWAPVPVIVDALEQTYELAFGSVTPSGKTLLVAVDSSGSMAGGWYGGGVTVGGSPIGPAYEVANAMAIMIARIEGGNAHFIDVDTRVHNSKVTPKVNLREAATWRPSGGGTDLSLPFSYAMDHKLKVDGIGVLSDMETWAGNSHPHQELQRYRSWNAGVRVIQVAMTPAGYGIQDPKDDNVLTVAGLDASLPKLITGFIR